MLPKSIHGDIQNVPHLKIHPPPLLPNKTRMRSFKHYYFCMAFPERSSLNCPTTTPLQ